MRFRANLTNPVGLYKIAQTLEKFGPTCIVSFGMDCIRFIKHREYEGSIEAWAKVQPSTLFSGYRVESHANNVINMAMQLEYLLRATRAAQQSTDISISLRRKGGQPILSWSMTSDNRAGSVSVIGQEIDVTIMPPERIRNIQEPKSLGAPDAYILLPSLHALRTVASRMKSLSKFLVLSANMAGVFKMSVETELAQCEAVYSDLENPSLEGHDPPEDLTEFSSVRIATDDFVSFLNSYHLEPQNAICAIIDELQVAFYVYVNIAAYQTHDPHSQQQPANASRMIMTCHVPVYYD